MADVFSDDPTTDSDQTPAIRVASALQGGDEEEVPEETPQAQQPQGSVDGAAQSYLVPAGADDDSDTPAAQSQTTDTPVSADTKAYATPITPPTLAPYQAPVDHSADQAAMTTQKTAESKENTKPSVWRRIGAGLAAGSVGFGTRNAEEGMKVGQEISGAPLVNAEHRWALQEAPIEAKLSADQAQDAATTRANAVTQDQNRAAETNYSNQIRGQYDAARAEQQRAQAQQRQQTDDTTPGKAGWEADDPSNPLGGYHATSVSGKPLHNNGVPASMAKDPDVVAATKLQSVRADIAARAATGKPYTQAEQNALLHPELKGEVQNAPRISIRENPDGSAVTPAGRGGANDPGAIIAKNMQDKQAYIDSITKQTEDLKDSDGRILSPKGSLVDKNGNTVTPQQYNDRLEKFRTDLNANPVMRKTGTMVDQNGNTVSNRFSRNPQPAAASPPQQQQPVYKAKSGGTVTVNTHVVVNGKPGIVTGFDAKGKPVVKY